MTALPLWQHLAEIENRLDEASHVLLLTDYDGTLTPLVDRPEDAVLAAPVRATLAAVAQQTQTTVGVVTGRALQDVRARVGMAELIYAGNHGLEIEGPGLTFRSPEAQAVRAELQAIAAELAQHLREIPQARIEDKGLTLSVHHRLVPESHLPAFFAALERVFAQLPANLRTTTGKMVHEVRPLVAWNKGHASVWIREQLRRPNAVPLFLGDDRTDEDAFAMLADGITVKVGPADTTKARYGVESPQDVARFLDWLATRPQ
jgi:trehalose-phosphatase